MDVTVCPIGLQEGYYILQEEFCLTVFQIMETIEEVISPKQ